MPIQSAKNQHHILAHGDKSVAIADVPVKISFMHGDETLQEYEDVIDLPFDTKTATGWELGKRMAILTMRQGHAIESALFTIASEAVKAQAVEILQTLAQTDLVKRASGHELHVRVLQNGDIPHRMPMKA